MYSFKNAQQVPQRLFLDLCGIDSYMRSHWKCVKSGNVKQNDSLQLMTSEQLKLAS